MKVSRILVVALLLVVPFTAIFAGKKDTDQIQALEEKIAAMELAFDRKITELEARLEIQIEESIQEIANREPNAMELFKKINALTSQGKMAEAQEQAKIFKKKYSGTQAAKNRQVSGLLSELAVIGKPAPAQFNMEKWIQGEAEVTDLAGDRVSVLVFWETWCPHCKKEAPKIEQLHNTYKGQDIQFIGVTKMSRNITDEQMAAFIETHGLTYPIAKEKGDQSQYFNVSGVPAAAVIKDGKIIWRGHPSRINDNLIKSWL